MDMTCTHCNGTGTSPVTGQDCHVCLGSGVIEVSGDSCIQNQFVIANNERLNEVLGIGNNVFLSYKILEALDTDEYDALTNTQKDGVKTLLSCGRVDLNEGKAGRVRLWNWFGAESTTVANLTALLS